MCMCIYIILYSRNEVSGADLFKIKSVSKRRLPLEKIKSRYAFSYSFYCGQKKILIIVCKTSIRRL